MGANIGDDIRKIMLAGVGAIATLAEKSAELVDALSEKGGKALEDAQPMLSELEKKGDEVLKQGRLLGEEAKARIKQAIEGIERQAQQMDAEEIASSLDGLTDEALEELERKLAGLRAERAQAGEPADTSEDSEQDSEQAE